MEVRYSAKALEDIAWWNASGQHAIQKKIIFQAWGILMPLVGNLAGYWSGRITKKDRLVYDIKDNFVRVHSLRGHYFDK